MIPLVLDLDGTVVTGDTLVESGLRLLGARPWALLLAMPLAWRSRAAFKHRIAAAARLDAGSLVYNRAVLDLARTARAQGRCVVLATAADRLVAAGVAAHLGLFDQVLASDGHTNLKAGAKSAALVARFGAGGFDYAGDSAADLAVWSRARQAIVVGPSARLLARARGVCAEVSVVGAAPSAGRRLVQTGRAMRLHQWAKNLLVLVPVTAAHQLHGQLLLQGGLGFLAFSLCASSVYVLNDLLDLPHDRLHATKRLRPFASGALDPGWGAALIIVLLAAALAAAALLPPAFLVMLAGYYATTLAYSFVLKRQAVWDVMALAGLYTLRIFAGAAATDIPISPWLLAFSLFLFFCLAIVKRLTELVAFVRAGDGTAGPAGRGYGPEDLDMLRSMAASSGTMAALVLALYVNSGEVQSLYRRPAALWALCPILLFWVSRVLMLSNRGLMNDDPVVFALRDRVSLLAGLASLAAVLAATL